MSVNQNISSIEAIILRKFETEPFHNLYFINQYEPSTTIFGGTCTDKVLSVYKELTTLGYECYLHTSLIKDVPSHFVLWIIIEDQVFLADVGNGWPNTRLFTLEGNTSYSSYGIRFDSVLRGEYLDIIQTRSGISRCSTSIPINKQDEEKARARIANRFNETYPFSNGLRFAQVVNDQFLFLRDLTLYIYNPGNNFPQKIKLKTDMIQTIISTKFRFDMHAFQEKLGIGELKLYPSQLKIFEQKRDK